MAKSNFVKPRRPVKLGTNTRPRISSSHRRPITKKDKPKPRGDATPDEGQEQAATEIAPIYVNPDGSIRYHAMLTATPNPETDTDDEKIED
jgi:hypothetical protein